MANGADDFVRSLNQATLKIVAQTTKKVHKAALYLEGEAVKEAPIDEGQLRQSMFSDAAFNEKEIVGIVGNTAAHSVYVHNGTGIYAKDGKGRKKPWKVTVKSGKYKGTWWTDGQRANPFLERAKQNSMSEIERILGGR